MRLHGAHPCRLRSVVVPFLVAATLLGGFSSGGMGAGGFIGGGGGAPPPPAPGIITIEQNVAEGFAGSATSHTTTVGPWTVATNQLIFVSCMPSIGVAPAPIPTVTGAGGVAFALFARSNLNAVRPTQEFYGAGVGGSGQVTIDYGASSVDLAVVVWVVNAADVTDPFAWVQSTTSLGNATSLTIHLQAFLDSTNNATFISAFSGNPSAADTGVQGGLSLVGKEDFPAAANFTHLVGWQRGQNLTPTLTIGSTPFSNGGCAWELRATNTPARPNDGYTRIAAAASTSNVSSATIVAPTYAGADLLELIVGLSRSTSPFAGTPTATGGGVTWTQRSTVPNAAGTYRLTILEATGPLDGTNVVITFGSVQEAHAYSLSAHPGGAVLQSPTGTALATATPSLAFAAPAAGSSLIAAFLASTISTGSGVTATLPGDGWVQLRTDPATATPHAGEVPGELRVGTPDLQLFVEYRWTSDLAADITYDRASDFVLAGLEVAA